MLESPVCRADGSEEASLPSSLEGHSEWSDTLLAQAHIPVVDCQITSVGGGLGSFALVDFLRIAGIPASQIRVFSDKSGPGESFAGLASASQLGPDERLRSDSTSTIDNLWGWPGYAFREALAEKTLTPLWRVLTEPILSEYFTPRVRTVLNGIDREAARIGWEQMLLPGRGIVVRRRQGGGFYVLGRRITAKTSDFVACRTQYVHLAVGHPGPRLLPDLLAFRQRYGEHQALHAYEPHEHVYDELNRSSGTVVLRGSGIVASRILERLVRDREQFGTDTQIVHLFRNYVEGPVGPLFFRRGGGEGFAYQPFNFPRGAGGGQLRELTLALSPQERARLIASMGGTTTARRRAWRRPLARGKKEGWYRVRQGVLTKFGRTTSGRLHLHVTDSNVCTSELEADFLIDATGLHAELDRHEILADLLNQGGASLNPLGGLDVEPSFEVRGTRHGNGRVYASGIAAKGGALAPVDSFWGLVHAAMEITDDLAGAGSCEFPNAYRSSVQWWRRLRNQPP